MTKSEYAFSLLFQRAAGGVIAAENTKQNGLLRANRNVIFTEYARRNRPSVIKGRHMIVCAKRM